MKVIRHILTLIVLLLCTLININAQTKTVYVYEIHDEIGAAMSRLTEKAVAAAEKSGAAYLMVDMDTYGGRVDDADNIRTALLKAKMPTLVFIRNNAASAGALISIACDSIYMTPGSTIGAASVVNDKGELMPEKYQSYMRKKMRATAEQTGRNPLIAEGMTDENLEIDSIKPAGKIITFSTLEAIKYGYCNAQVQRPEDVLPLLKGGPYVMVKHESTAIEAAILWLINPAVSGLLLLLIFGGIYFEFKAPGTMLPIAVSVAAAVVYFAPLYLEGLAENWEILVFAIGIILVLLEIFVIPGHGVPLITGIILAVAGLTLSLVRNVGFDFTFVPGNALAYAFLMVAVAMSLPLILLVAFGQKIFHSSIFKRVSVEASMKTSEGFSIRDNAMHNLIGTAGLAATDLRPAGKVEVSGELYDAIADGSYITRHSAIKITGVRSAYLVVERANI